MIKNYLDQRGRGTVRRLQWKEYSQTWRENLCQSQKVQLNQLHVRQEYLCSELFRKSPISSHLQFNFSRPSPGAEDKMLGLTCFTRTPPWSVDFSNWGNWGF